MDTSQEILSDVVVWQKYAKFVPSLNRRETWNEICDRNVAMHVNKYPALKEEINEVYQKFVLSKKVLPSMRSLQFGGTPIELSNARIYNCSYLPIDHTDSFSETMFLLLSGCGVGFSVQKHHISKLPIVKGPKDKHRRFLIGDSIEGWADAIKILVESYFYNKSEPIFDYRDIRPKGARLITSGGKAPGPAPLRICIEHLRNILEGAVNRNLEPIEAHDMLCHIADAVLSGGIRRAAMISLFSKDDQDMLSAKSGSWWELNPQRGRANNSVVLNRKEVTDEEFFDIWERIEDSGAGEPGIYWTNNEEYGTNPCCISGDATAKVKLGDTDEIQVMRVKDIVALFNDGIYFEILSWDGDKPVFKPISNALKTKTNAEVLKITDEDTGKSLVCTPDHLIFTKNRGYVRADMLEPTDELQLS